ncbi:hypothetical protein RW1_038_01040 [Rhodococcus wratislaviensis NBRC 100605]|uniref:YjgF/YER057c/UK114 family protein n=2 Tax=Rhodococcus wratislaviensis TaxID=44752 RepID=X0Q706_RHOWR|nr:hypothetical protein RW1_038_01040 [Rhodococcus wratislaviensis NBRC 100605]
MLTRFESNDKLSRVVVHGDSVYLSGLTPSDRTGGIRDQVAQVLGKIDHHLTQAGTDRSRILFVQIWLKDIARDFDEMNRVWSRWLSNTPAPARATGEVALAHPDILVEMIVTATR